MKKFPIVYLIFIMMRGFSLPYFIILVLISYFVVISTGENVKKSIDDNREDNGENDEAKEESLDIAVENDATNVTCTRRQNSLMHEITAAQHKQFPFMAAVMSHQNEYMCSGSVVSNGLILTTAKCTDMPIRYVLLNTTKDKKDDTAVVLHITKTEKFPTYSGGSDMKDVGLIYTEKHNNSVASKIRLSNFTNLRGVVDIEGIGFGLNAEVGQPRELQYIGMEHHPSDFTAEKIMGHFDCVETKVLTCYKDTGGPVIFDNELVGIVTQGQEECTKEISATYSMNKKLAEVLPTYTFKTWLDEKIKKNEEQEQTSLLIYPSKPTLREGIHKMTARNAGIQHNSVNFFVLVLMLISMFY